MLGYFFKIVDIEGWKDEGIEGRRIMKKKREKKSATWHKLQCANSEDCRDPWLYISLDGRVLAIPFCYDGFRFLLP